MPAKLSIVPLTPFLLPKAFGAAHADGHRLIATTHVGLRDGEPVGAFSAFLPTVFFWSQTGNSARDTLTLIQAAEANAGQMFVVPCDLDSPIHPLLMKRKGYELAGHADLFLVAKP